MKMFASSEMFLFAEFRLDPAGGGLFRCDDHGAFAPVTIGSRALDLLGVLIERRGDVVSKEEIMAAVWPKMAVEEANLFVQISALRAILDREQSGQSCIQTVTGRGYRFVAPVKRCAGGMDSHTLPGPLFPVDGVKPPVPLAEARPPEPQPSSIPSAERRRLTVMACELVGSAALSSRLDPEDLRVVIAAFRRVVAKIVARFDGFVGKSMGEYIGEGVLVYFGYPTAQENDAERAVRAALAIQRALSEHNSAKVNKGAPELSARIGLDCGLVVVDSTGEVFGEPPNVAARVLTAAEPGTVLVTTNVLRQAPGLFVTEERSESCLVGMFEPVNLFRVVRASGGRRRGAARPLTPFIGREEELGLLTRRWERAQAGEGQLVFIVGEPGIGKSRLVEEFRAKLAETSHTWAEWSALQLLQNTPLHPIAEWGRLRFQPDSPAEQRLADLENTLALIGLDPAEYAPLLAPLVDIPLPASRAPNLPPEELRRRQLEAVVAWVLAGARSQPIALAFEDLQWADPTSLDLLRALAKRIAQAPLLIIATARPEFPPTWSMRSHHSVISLTPLDRAQVRQMVGDIASRHALSREVVEGVSERTGGVPLFVEEVTRLLLERGEAGGLQAIPPTLQQSLAARLDRLGGAREAAQIGAVLGRDFTFALLSAVAAVAPVAAVDDRGYRGGSALSESGYSDRSLQSALDRLVDADLLFVQGAGAQATYRFKHALIQDAAYESLLKSRRQALHRRAGEILRDKPESAAAAPEVIAHHFTEAGLDDLAIEWWGRAGEQALRRSAFQEAIAHLTKAIAMADKTAGGESQTTPTRRLKLQADYRRAVMWSKGFAAEETEAAFARASEIAAAAQDPVERFAGYYGQWSRSLMRAELRSAREIAEAFLRESEAEGRTTEAGVAHRILGGTCFTQGELADARAHYERALGDFAPARDGETRFRFGWDNGIMAAAQLAWPVWFLGEVERARRLSEQAIRDAIGSGHVATLVHAHWMDTVLVGYRHDADATLRTAETLVRLGREHRMDLHAAAGEVYAGWAHGRLTDPERGSRGLRNALGTYVAQGNRLFVPYFLGLRAELEAETRSADVALTLIDEGLAISQETGERISDSFLYRLRGEILLIRDPANLAPAEQAFQTAVAIARHQGARSYELLGALALAKLNQSTGRPAEARAVLAPALKGFSPTPEMPEIAEALALIERLA
jgi:class 3 adenylate cyclase/DNA-binding winged helix-turn-helix (wHTH) protein/predicted ATPase